MTWSLPSENKYKPDGFKLYYRKLNNEKSGPIDLAANSTQYLLGDLGKAALLQDLMFLQLCCERFESSGSLHCRWVSGR